MHKICPCQDFWQNVERLNQHATEDRIEDGIFLCVGWIRIYILVPIHWSPNFPKRSQLRRKLFISGFHGLISSDKAGARIRKLGRQTEVEAGRSSGSYHKIVFVLYLYCIGIVFVLYLLNNREIFFCNFYLEIRRTEVGTGRSSDSYHKIVLICNILCSFQEYLYNLILFVQYSWNICLRFWFGS